MYKSNSAVQMIRVNALDIHYKQYGMGKDVLFLHGTPGSLEDWEGIIKDIPDCFRITLVDRPGYGKSDSITGKINLENNAKVIIKLIELLDLRDVIVVGHSYGACIVLRMAVEQVPSVKGYISIAGPAYRYNHAKKYYRAFFSPVIGRILTRILSSELGKKIMKEEINNAFGPNIDSIPDDFVNSRVKDWLHEKVLNSFAHEEIELNNDLRLIAGKYKNVLSNVIILQGDKDKYVSVSEANKLASDVRNSKLIIVNGVGHYVQFVKPKLIIESIIDLDQRLVVI